ncbi:hypothetical protein J2X31_001008 [Flavobacterium arsenatis]|uniref:Lnb N-terminal periplasmic domain-containing protein n=1 Tax=Flavobacterium arsenatis TaxID=1484332 RepID=A0ABU1TM98_9FLAO|nr:DUF4105 domain-containing protein [Flavobacterium arsenatis]MDR6967008.1 hypothetical protein [Flavobacterium arsenatis]
MIKKLLLFSFFIFSQIGFSQSLVSDNTVVSILTVGTADASHSLYGHTALRIKDETKNIDLVYNYGMFDFSTPNFMFKFVKGDLQYYAAAYPYDDFEYSYRVENRSIYEQVLNLSNPEKELLIKKLDVSLSSDDKFYTYKFIDRNCTTKVIDVVNGVLEGKPIVKKNIDSKTYRDVLFPYVENHFYQKLGINIIFGHRVDNQAIIMFLPLDLFENLKVSSYKDKPLVTETNVIFEANRPSAFSFLDSIYSLIAVLLLFVLIKKKAMQVTYFLILGLIGLLFSLIGLYSLHQEVLWNYNVLLFNPLFLVLLYFMATNNLKWIKKLSWICLAFLGIYVVYMLNKIHIFIVLPIVITTAILLLRLIYPERGIIGLGRTKPY